MKLYALFVLAMLAQVTSGRTQLLAMRGHIVDRSGLIATLLGIASGLSFFAVIIWGFASLHWYVALPTVIVMCFSAAFIVHLRSFAFWYQMRALVDLVTVVLTIVLWVIYWPF